MGIKALSLNSLNAVNNLDALANIVHLSCRIRLEFLLDITKYCLADISSNHKRNIKKSLKAGAGSLLGRVGSIVVKVMIALAMFIMIGVSISKTILI